MLKNCNQIEKFKITRASAIFAENDGNSGKLTTFASETMATFPKNEFFFLRTNTTHKADNN